MVMDTPQVDAAVETWTLQDWEQAAEQSLLGVAAAGGRGWLARMAWRVAQGGHIDLDVPDPWEEEAEGSTPNE